MDSSANAIVGKDLHSVVTGWNEGVESLFGYTAQEMLGRFITRLVPPDRRAEEDFILACVRRGERVENFETVRLTKGGPGGQSATAARIMWAEDVFVRPALHGISCLPH